MNLLPASCSVWHDSEFNHTSTWHTCPCLEPQLSQLEGKTAVTKVFGTVPCPLTLALCFEGETRVALPTHTHFLSKRAKLMARAEREITFISPYLQHINVSIAEVDVEDFGQRDSRTQYSCKGVGEVRSDVARVAKRWQPGQNQPVFSRP